MKVPENIFEFIKKGGIAALLFLGLKYMDGRVNELERKITYLENSLKDCQEKRVDDLKERMLLKSINYTAAINLPMLAAVLTKDEEDE